MNKQSMFAIIAAVVLLGACSNPSSWYPSGTASLAGSYEVDDGTVKSVVVTVTLENTGDSAINHSTFTVQAQTDTRLYWKTATVDTRILPGAKIKATVEVVYAVITETLAVNGVSIIDPFFE